jgi:hypothetical protein
MHRTEWSTRVVGIAEARMIDPSEDSGIMESTLHSMIERAYYLNLSAIMIEYAGRVVPSALLASFFSEQIERPRFTKLWIRLKPSELMAVWDPLLRLLDYTHLIGIGKYYGR